MLNEIELIGEVKKADSIDKVFSSISQFQFARLSSRLTSVVAKKLKEFEDKSGIRVAVLGNYTVDLLTPHIATSFASIGLTSKCYVAPYNQYYQEVLQPQSELQNFNADIVVLLLAMRELSPDIHYRYAEMTKAQRQQQSQIVSDHILQWVKSACINTTSTVLVANFIPPTHPKLGLADYREDETEIEFYQNLNKRIKMSLLEIKQAYLLDLASLSLQVGWNNIYDPKMYYLAKLLWSEEFSSYVSQEIVKFSLAIKGLTKKCLVLDLDNTLWGGILGEDGIKGIKAGKGDPVSEAYADFQHKIKSLKQRGVILAICSKNNLEDVTEAFKARDDFPLKLSDFAAVRINWEMKHKNLTEIADELNIGIDSLVFIDDNPVEITLIKKMLPEVTSLLLPSLHETMPAFIDSLPYFEKLFITDADRDKTQQYHQNKKRTNLKSQAEDLEEYLHSLETKVTLRTVETGDAQRIHQLFSKTNQFNLTTIRYSLNDIGEFIASKNYDLLCFSVEDNFGNLGVVGLLLILKTKNNITIDSFIMSCRAMGRGIETAIINWLKENYLFNKKVFKITASYIPTRKNLPVQNFYFEQGFVRIEKSEKEHCYQLELKVAKLKHCDWINFISKV